MSVFDLFKKKAPDSSARVNYVNNPTAPLPVVPPAAPKFEDRYEFFKLRVAGVTFKNGKTSRQTILRKIKFRDEPFTKMVDLSISDYEYEGEIALGVYANNEQIGNVPKEKVQYLLDNWDRIDTITHIDVLGGGRTSDGEPLSYGAEITIRLNKEKG